MRIRVRKGCLQNERAWKHARVSRPGERSRSRQDSLPPIRIACYRGDELVPEIEDIRGATLGELLGRAAVRTYALAREEGSRIAHSAIREIIDNLIHAGCADATVTILHGGRAIVVSDQGDGIRDKERALRPGFTTAQSWMRRHIKGVGSGFVVAAESMERIEGRVRIEDNLAGGAVVTLEEGTRWGESGDVCAARPRQAPPGLQPLTERQRRALLVLAESQDVGPTALSRELGTSLATAHRELEKLERMGLVQYVGKGKRTVTSEGLTYVRSLFQG